MSWEAQMNAIRTRFKTLVADAHPVAVAYEGLPFDQPTGSPWVRFSIRPGQRLRRSLGKAPKRYRMPGVAIAQIFVPVESGEDKAWKIADRIEAAFRAVIASGVVYDTPYPQAVGREGNELQLNVVCPFRIDDLL